MRTSACRAFGGTRTSVFTAGEVRTSEALAHVLDEVDERAGVAELVVVPADELDLVADDLG